MQLTAPKSASLIDQPVQHSASGWGL